MNPLPWVAVSLLAAAIIALAIAIIIAFWQVLKSHRKAQCDTLQFGFIATLGKSKDAPKTIPTPGVASPNEKPSKA